MERMLSVSFGEHVRRAIELFYLLYPEGAFEKRVLDIVVLDEVEKNDTRCPVRSVFPVEGIEEGPEEIDKFEGPRRGAGQFCLGFFRVERLLFQEDGDLDGGETITPRLDAGRFEIS